MSAFLLSESHFAYMLRAAVPVDRESPTRWSRGRIDGPLAEQLIVGARQLVEANLRSLKARYGSPYTRGKVESMANEAVRIALLIDGQRISSRQTLMCCQSYEYQSWESSTWKRSAAHSLMEAIERKAINRLMGSGVNEPLWEITADNLPKALSRVDA